jgi:proteic killer suppression protein
MINSANELSDLRAPPGNRLEALKGDLAGFHRIRINDQWRVIFDGKTGKQRKSGSLIIIRRGI